MRRIILRQPSIVESTGSHQHTAELRKIDEILHSLPRIAGLVHEDLVRGLKDPRTGRQQLRKKRGLDIAEMAKSTWVYKRRCDFRAGIEGMISFAASACVAAPGKATNPSSPTRGHQLSAPTCC